MLLKKRINDDEKVLQLTFVAIGSDVFILTYLTNFVVLYLTNFDVFDKV